MFDDRRKFLRFDVPLKVEIKKSQEYYSSGVTKNFSREGFSLVAEEFDFEPKNYLEARIELPQQNGFVNVYGEIIWKRQIGDKWQVGIRLSQIDKASKDDILSYAYENWKNRMREELISSH